MEEDVDTTALVLVSLVSEEDVVGEEREDGILFRLVTTAMPALFSALPAVPVAIVFGI